MKDLFSEEPALRPILAPVLLELAAQGVHIGTSSWKYPGWVGSIYEESRYRYRGKLAKTRFERDCLEEYAETFPTVCVDAGYYRFPDPRFIDRIATQVPDHFRFSFKVTDEITVARFPRIARHRDRAGQLNENFLDAGLFQRAFLKALAPHREKIGCLIFEFTQISKRDLEEIDFLSRLATFLREIPSGWQYAVELRNAELLGDDYFAALSSSQAAHVYNSWERMPGIDEQRGLPSSRSTDFLASRLLLKPGRRYAEAVDRFEPYQSIQQKLPEVRKTAAEMVRELLAERKRDDKGRPSFLYVNNRLEGNSPLTIKGILEEAGLLEPR